MNLSVFDYSKILFSILTVYLACKAQFLSMNVYLNKDVCICTTLIYRQHLIKFAANLLEFEMAEFYGTSYLYKKIGNKKMLVQ
jgi:hypothetical protein